MSTILTAIDALLCVLVVLAALEYLRAVDFMKHPVLAIAFYLVAIGAFGLLVEMIRGSSASFFSVTLHSGVVLYAWARRQYIFTQDWSWKGEERRNSYESVGLIQNSKAPGRNP
ncbi:hypothetical protein [Pseudomonas vancouverensis]|uniref:Uncharacterized protein n=1 Tax=Pseudomonas vancouverensis TaxID=95300 RepID=A0A1H2MUC9_PSEVA|nr:hypothetical protein [Pseudomonas vancouverensis]KAB0489705.1 hypothetical protein F7R09_28730 [Pseudomonas vancouverensis]TDB67201.1 hypothetical protein EIY72_03900 [Pseudomonas vancouverensis]SDU96903.1 hypothetical protein SAMN05216558_1296 [Pseudomonas vancouverensis]